MANGAVLNLLFMLGIFQKGLTALIETQQTVMAAVGEEACLNCHLIQSKDVLQVTWQKLLPEGEENIATDNKYFGKRVNAGFQGKVAFKAAGLQNSSIVMKKVTEQDEGCYRCLFNTYPEGALTGYTCLKLVFEAPKPVPLVGEPNPTEEAVFSDSLSQSATDRPVLTATSDSTGVIVGVSVLAIFLVAVIIIVVVLLLRKHQNCLPHKDPEEIKTPLKPVQRTDVIKTPLNQQENEQVRLRMSTGTGKKRVSPKASSLTAQSLRKQLF